MKTHTSSKIVAGVSDIFFASKISETARQVGVQVEFAASQDAILTKASSLPSLIIVDLGQDSLDPISLIRRLKEDPSLGKVPVVAFANHERTDLMEGAKQAGCDQVLTRGAFSSGLPQMLQQHG